MHTTPRYLALLIAATFVLGACGGDGDSPDEAAPGTRSAGCKGGVSVVASSLPPGFDRTLKEGAGGDKDTPKDTIAYHWAGANDDSYIDVFRGGLRNKIKEPTKVRFLGRAGRYGKIPDGVAARVRLGRGKCTVYHFEAFGVTEDDFKKTLASLRRTPGATAEEE